MIVKRSYITELNEVGKFSPVIGILGPRQVGKTTLAKEFAKKLKKGSIYIDLEKPSDFQKLAEPELYFQANSGKCIIIDEIQIKPELFKIIRALVDEKRVPLRFILLGSASPEIMRDSSESLAGRISYIHMNPFSFTELSKVKRKRHHFFGGFPNSILAKNDNQATRWLDDFIKTYVERDLQLLGIAATPQFVRKLWEMLAWQNGGLLNASAIGKSLGVSNHTINRYIEFLEGTFLVKTIQPYANNPKKRIVKTPKIYLTDTGILHRLLRLNSFEELSGNPILGASFESYVIQQILAEKPKNLDLYFYRTHAGTEIDIVLTKAMKPIACIEIKYTSTPVPSKGFYFGIDDLGTSKNFILTPSSDSYPLKKNVTVTNLEDFLSKYLHKLSK
jgi:predicted AAA+ superfamily ATPase